MGISLHLLAEHGAARLRGVKLAPSRDSHERRLKAGGVADSEQLLGVGTGTARATHLDWDGQIDVQPAIGSPAVPLASAFDHRLGGIQSFHSMCPPRGAAWPRL